MQFRVLIKSFLCILFIFAGISAQATDLHEKAAALAQKTENLNPNVLELALKAEQKARAKGLVKRPYLTIIDYSKSSVEKRMWVFDLKENTLIYETHVTHGVNSGRERAKVFSNVMESRKSSLGVFTTAEPYYGSKGYSLRLDGHEKGINDNARRRGIVMHGADYASEDFIKKYGTLGNSWACPAVDTAISRQLINTIQGGSLVFAYYPNNNWLKTSAFLNENPKKPSLWARLFGG